jgi:DNA mismatch endonuclease (patch repair protein)
MLHRMGCRFSLRRRKDLPGNPDVVLCRRRVAVFVHGCFWHRHKNCRNSVTPKTRTEFWVSKLESNIRRDRSNASALKKLGWRVFVVWECELENETKLLKKIGTFLKPDHD